RRRSLQPAIGLRAAVYDPFGILEKSLEGRTMNAIHLKFSKLPTDYQSLVSLHPPRPLHDAVDEQNVEELIAAMAGHPLSKDQEDYLELLSDLLLKYQAASRPPRVRSRTTPHQRLKFLMQESQMTPKKLATMLGCSQPLVSLILSGKRELSKENIKKLAAHFRLDAGYFM